VPVRLYCRPLRVRVSRGTVFDRLEPVYRSNIFEEISNNLIFTRQRPPEKADAGVRNSGHPCSGGARSAPIVLWEARHAPALLLSARLGLQVGSLKSALARCSPTRGLRQRTHESPRARSTPYIQAADPPRTPGGWRVTRWDPHRKVTRMKAHCLPVPRLTP
jgi:hypothetical protein